MSDVPMVNPSASCEHHFISHHQPHFPDAAYWVLLCQFCDRIEIEGRNEPADFPDCNADTCYCGRSNCPSRVERQTLDDARRVLGDAEVPDA